jgi:hypothetical protein
MTMGDFRFQVDPRIFTADTPKPAKPADPSFEITGGFLHPSPSRPTAPLPRSTPSSPDRLEPAPVSIVRQPQSKNSKAMERFTIRLPRELIAAVDEIAAETHLSASAIVRQALEKAVRKRRKGSPW